MIWPAGSSLLLLLAIGCCHGNSAVPRRVSNRVQERAGGFLEVGAIPAQLREACGTILNIESVLSTFPLNLMKNVVYTIPLPIPNPLILDPLRLFEWSISVMSAIQDSVNRITGDGPAASSRKRDLASLLRSYEIDLIQEQLSNIHEKMNVAFERFNFEDRSDMEREAEDPGKPGYLLNLQNVMDIVEYLCPMIDTADSFMKTSFLGFLKIDKFPLPFLDGTPVNILKALDIYDIGGAIESVWNSFSGLFVEAATTTTTPAPIPFLGGFFGSAPLVTTPAPNFFEGVASSVGNFFGIFGGGAASPAIGASEVQNDDEMEAPPEPEVIVAVAPLTTTTIAPVKLNGSILGVDVDWLFGNDSANPIVLPTTANVSKEATTTLSSVSVKVTGITASSTKDPVANLFDTFFGSGSAVTSSPRKPSTAPSPTTTTASTTRRAPSTNTTQAQTTTKAPVVNLMEMLFGSTPTTKPSTTLSSTTTTTTTVASSVAAKANQTSSQATTVASTQTDKVSSTTTAATAPATPKQTDKSTKSGGLNLFGWQI